MTPRTEAGRQLPETLRENGVHWFIDGSQEAENALIAAIEAEAIAAHEVVCAERLDRVAVATEEALRERGWRDEYETATDAAMNYGDGAAAERAAIRAAVEKLDEPHEAGYLERAAVLDIIGRIGA